MKKISRLTALLASLVVPFIAAAQTGINTGAITPYADGIKNVINNILVPVLMALAFIVFLWGVYKYFILGASDEKSRTDGRQFTFWGIIGFVIILSVWGIVNLFMSTLGLSVGTPPPFPTIGGSSYNGGSISGAQNAALSNLNQLQIACTQSDSSVSAACQAANNAWATYNATYPPPVSGVTCVYPQVYDSDTGTCVDSVFDNTINSVNCVSPQVYDSDTGTCVDSVFDNTINSVNCVSPQVYDSDTGTCVDSVLYGCTDPDAINYQGSSPCEYNP